MSARDAVGVSIADACRKFTIAAYSLGHSVVLTEQQPGREWEPWTYRCTWRRAGPLGPGEYREAKIDPEVLNCRPTEETFHILAKTLIRPLVGEDMYERITIAYLRLEDNQRAASVPVEFYGGPKDGEAWTVRADRNGMPQEHLIAIAAPTESLYDPNPTTEGLAIRKLLYRRGTLDEERGVWRFEFGGSS